MTLLLGDTVVTGIQDALLIAAIAINLVANTLLLFRKRIGILFGWTALVFVLLVRSLQVNAVELSSLKQDKATLPIPSCHGIAQFLGAI
ncbi:MAG: hypothetical protein GY799_13435 [Desulfobulbaceae bacterium]|nr:hypothetical protein [Desulfobulbaceae bacterium]